MATNTFTARRQEPASRSASEDLLARYLRDVSALHLLQPEQELELAENIEALEVALWSTLLGHPRLAAPLLRLLERLTGQRSDLFTELHRAAKAFNRRPVQANQERLTRWSMEAARFIRPLDLDRRHLDVVLTKLRELTNGEERHIFKGLRVNPSTRSFEAYQGRIKALQDASQGARDAFVRGNLRLVVSIARRYNFGQIPLHDLIQEGNLGLIKAVGRFDHRRRLRFSTYASWWIRHAITRAIANTGRLVRVPVHMLSTFQVVTRMSRELTCKLGRPPTAEEICASTSLSDDKVTRVQERLPHQVLSLDTPVSEEQDGPFIELVPDPAVTSPVDSIGARQILEQVQALLGQLKPIEVDVLRKRFGLADGDARTLSDIGDDYALSRERIRQIQEQALDKIRCALVQRNAM